MPKIYKRNCNNCGEYYEGEGMFFCSQNCSQEGQKRVGLFEKGQNIGNQFAKGNKPNKTSFKKGYDVTKHWNWKGGITPLMHRIRQCFEYRQWRSDVFTRDDFICQNCLIKGGNLEAHHIKEFAKIIHENNIKTLDRALNCEELWNINNGQTLCLKCHNATKQKK